MFYCSEKSWSFVTNNHYSNSVVKYTIKHSSDGTWSLRYYINDDNDEVFDESMLVREVKDEPSLIKLLRTTICYGSPDEIIETILKIVSALDLLLFSVTKHDPNQIFTRGCDTTYYSIQNIWWNYTLNRVQQGSPVLGTITYEKNLDVNISIGATNGVDANIYRAALIDVLLGKSHEGFVVIDPYEGFVTVDPSKVTSK